MRRLFTLGLIASSALSLAMPALAAPSEGRGHAARQNGGESGRVRAPSGNADQTRQSAPPASRQGSARPAPQRQASAPPAVRNTRVPPSSVGNQWRGQARPAPRLGTGGAEATNWPNQRRIDAGQDRRPGGMRAYEGTRYQNSQNNNAPSAASTGRQPDRGGANAGRWNNGERRPDGQWRGDDRRWNDNGRHYDNRGNNWRDNNGRGGDWNRGRHLNDRERWTDYRRWDNQGWRRDRRYDWQNYRSYHRDLYRLPRYYAPYGWNYGYSRFSIGIFLNSLLYANDYWIDDPYYYRLPPAYGYLRWIRYYDDALLVDIRDGYVVDVIHNFFW